MRKVFVRSAYNYDPNVVSRETGTDTGPESMTQQSFKDECDINTIVRRFGVTGEMPVVSNPPTYQNFEGIFDYQSAMNAIRQAEESFASLPADVRKRFQNSPQMFVEFCSDGKNLEEMRKMGLANPAPPVDNTPAPNGSGTENGNAGNPKT